MKILNYSSTLVWRLLLALILGCTLSACASDVFHVFQFDMRLDNQDAVVLDYRYGSASNWIGPKEGEFTDGRTFSFENVGGTMPRPDFLYVKWRNNTTGEVYEDKADLRKRLPRDFEGQRVYFMIRGSQLYVYLIAWEPRQTDAKPIGPSASQDKKTTLIYPDMIFPIHGVAS